MIAITIILYIFVIIASDITAIIILVLIAHVAVRIQKGFWKYESLRVSGRYWYWTDSSMGSAV